MTKPYRKETTVDGIKVVECGYESGLIEIGVYRPPVALPKADHVLVAVVDRMPGVRKWFVHAQRSRQARFLNKAKAVAAAVAIAAAQLAAVRAQFPEA